MSAARRYYGNFNCRLKIWCNDDVPDQVERWTALECNVSLILDALKRSEQDRVSPAGVPGVSTQHYPDSVATGSNWLQALPWAGLLIALMIIGWLVVGEQDSPDPTDVVPAVTAEQEQIEPVPGPAQPAVPPQQAPASPPAPAGQPAPTTLPDALEKAAVPEVERDHRPVSELPPEPAVAELYEASSAEPVVETPPVADVPASAKTKVTASGAKETPLDIDALVQQAEKDLAQAQADEHPAPFISALSQGRKDRIPTIYYSRHDYNKGGNSTVVLNGKTRRAGATMGNGVTVVEILADSVVLRHAGSEFRLQALNSWVNL
jgi:general secretion pathway protein B